jgi:hypothetical protein
MHQNSEKKKWVDNLPEQTLGVMQGFPAVILKQIGLHFNSLNE